MKRLHFVSTCALLCACASAPPLHVEDSRRTRDIALDTRADTLLRRLLELPGNFSSDGHVYTFMTDDELVEDLASLELHAVPALVECLGDDRVSRVTHGLSTMFSGKPVLVGGICSYVLHETYFAQMRDDSLFARAQALAGVDPHGHDGYASYESDKNALRRARTIWRAYLGLHRAAGSPRLPKLLDEGVGCYEMRLHRTKHDLPIDTTKRWIIELDTLPLPGTVRPERLELASHIVVEGRARWKAHYENRILVSWRNTDSSTYFGLSFGGNETTAPGFQLVQRDQTPKETFGGVTMTRTKCAHASGR